MSNAEKRRPPADPSSSEAESGDPSVDLIRSEERLRVGTAVRVSGRAVLRRYVVTETVTQTFEVRHEEVRVEHEPAADGAVSSDRSAFDDRVVEVVLHREVPVVQMRVEAVERVRLHVDTVTEQVTLTEDLRKEQLDLDVPDQQTAP